MRFVLALALLLAACTDEQPVPQPTPTATTVPDTQAARMARIKTRWQAVTAKFSAKFVDGQQMDNSAAYAADYLGVEAVTRAESAVNTPAFDDAANSADAVLDNYANAVGG